MATTPTWQAGTSGSVPKSAHATQFLGTHAMQVLYTGVQRAAQTTAGSGNVSTNGLYLAQSFSTASGQTAIGYVVAQILATEVTGVETSPGPTTLSLHANSSGAPASTTLASVTLSQEYGAFTPTWAVLPLPVTGLTASTTYWLVLAAAGNATYHYTWNKSNQASGASTSTNGTSWTAQSYGLLFQVYDQTVTGQQVATWEDSGARWTWTGRNATGTINAYAAYTAGQTTSGYCQAYRNFTSTNGLLTGVT